MNIRCQKCKEWFELGPQCSKTERFEVSSYLACPKCGFLLPSLDFVGIIRWSEFLSWVNDHNKQILESKRIKPQKSLWEVIVFDRSLKEVLASEKLLGDRISDPSLRITVRSVEQPDNTFILGKFKEYLNAVYKRGYISPIIRIRFICIASDGRYFDL